MKKFIVGVLVLVMCLSLCACGTNENTVVNYKEYTVGSITFELPEEWNITQDGNGYKAQFDNEYASFSVMLNNNVPAGKKFEFLCESHMVELIESIGGNVQEYAPATHSNYEAYDYEAEANLQGKTVPVKATVISADNSAIAFLLICGDDNYNYTDVYNHIINSIH